MSKSEGKNPVLQPIPLSAILDPTYQSPFSKLEKFQVDMEIPEVQHSHHLHNQSSSSPTAATAAAAASMWHKFQFATAAAAAAAMGGSDKNHGSSPRAASELAGLRSPVHYWDLQIGSFSGCPQVFQNSDLQSTIVNAMPNFVIISQPVLTTTTTTVAATAARPRGRDPSSCDDDVEDDDEEEEEEDDDDDIVFSYSSSVPEDLYLDGDVFQSEGVDQTDFLKPDSQGRKKKKVSFNEEQLESVLEFEDDQDSKCARETYWEMLARDRCRFQDRICRTEDVIGPILCSSHRSRVFKERFLDGQEEN